MVRFYKDGDRMAIQTTAIEEDVFIGQVAVGLDHIIGAQLYQDDWEFQLVRWLPAYHELLCALQGRFCDVTYQADGSIIGGSIAATRLGSLVAEVRDEGGITVHVRPAQSASVPLREPVEEIIDLDDEQPPF